MFSEILHPMSDFVNFGKRGVTLPRGCKNLIDVLHGKAASKVPQGKTAFKSSGVYSDVDFSNPVTATNSHLGKLGDIGRFVEQASRSAAVIVQLTPRPESCATSGRGQDSQKRSSVETRISNRTSVSHLNINI